MDKYINNCSTNSYWNGVGYLCPICTKVYELQEWADECVSECESKENQKKT